MRIKCVPSFLILFNRCHVVTSLSSISTASSSHHFYIASLSFIFVLISMKNKTIHKQIPKLISDEHLFTNMIRNNTFPFRTHFSIDFSLLFYLIAVHTHLKNITNARETKRNISRMRSGDDGVVCGNISTRSITNSMSENLSEYA